MALQTIGDSRGRVAQKIAAHSIELHQLGGEVQLHWVPVHRNILGNELADLITRQVKIGKTFATTRQFSGLHRRAEKLGQLEWR